MFKKSIPFLLLIFIVLNCSKTPESVAKKFFDTLAEGNLEKAKEYGTENTRETLSLCQAFAREKDYKELKEASKAEISNCKIENDKAKCEIKNFKFKDGYVKLVKVNNEWKVDWNK